MLNRAALILRHKQQFVDWINAADPNPRSHTLTLLEVNEEHTVYLVEVEDENELAAWLARNHQELFEEELNGWYTDPALWPRDRSLTTLKRGCSFELEALKRVPRARLIKAEGVNLLDLIALLLVEAAEEIVRLGLLRDYVERDDLLLFARGRLLSWTDRCSSGSVRSTASTVASMSTNKTSRRTGC
jgi:hypothetical protein